MLLCFVPSITEKSISDQEKQCVVKTAFHFSVGHGTWDILQYLKADALHAHMYLKPFRNSSRTFILCHCEHGVFFLHLYCYIDRVVLVQNTVEFDVVMQDVWIGV